MADSNCSAVSLPPGTTVRIMNEIARSLLAPSRA